MKKIITISLLLVITLLLVFILTGGAGQDSSSQNENDKITTAGLGVPDFEKPEENADISGIVKTIIGNEVTILKIDRPGMSQDEDGESDGKDESETKQESGSGGGMGMGMGGGMGGQLNAGTDDSDERLEMLKSMSTGEEKVIIPIGIKMLKSKDGEAIEVTLVDIAKNQMLMIWIDQSITDKNIANFVMIKE